MVLKRHEVPVEETWSLSDMFPDQAAWEAEYAAVEAALPRLRALIGQITEMAATGLAALNAFDELVGRDGRVNSYAYYLYQEDTTNPGSQALAGRARMLSAQVAAATSELQAALIRLPEGTLERWIAEEPAMADFRFLLQLVISFRPHALTPEAEAALAAVGQTLDFPYQAYSTITSADMTFGTVADSQGNQVPISLFFYMTQVETSPDTLLRRRGYEALSKGLEPYKNGLAGTLATEVRTNVDVAKMRGYKSAVEMLLTGDGLRYGRQADAIPEPVFHQVLDIMLQELSPHMQRYARLRKRVLGLDKLLFSDVKAPLDPGFDPRVSFDEAGRMLCEAVKVLGPEYHATMERAFSERWVYRGDNVGRGMIAFGGGTWGVHGYSLYPWGGNLFDVFLLGHELGHACHFDLAMRNQRAVNMGAANFFVETPSTLTEQILVNHVRATTSDPRLHRWLNMYLMMSYHHNCVTHILEAELLRRLYTMAEAGRPLTTSTISQTKLAILQQFWGDTVEWDDGAALTWMRQPHYYMGLYPYTYSVGISAATVLAQ
ncbi:MAG TPA: M3 family metallopeptidase, partial [Symbiobacteriaceae bacterium]|nr:M3 family metallopeptidase [Symbiobacteriaceae bacterium]